MAKTYQELMLDYERTIITTTLARNNGDRQVAASVLGITRRTLEKILKRHHLVRSRFTKPLPIPPSKG
jgi:DNA-binding NtrC family response regulator